MKKILLGLLLSTVGLSGCSFLDFGKIKSNEYAPEIAVPLVDAAFTVDDILTGFEAGGGQVGAGSDGVIRLIYESDITQFTADSLFALPSMSPPNIPLVSGGPSVKVPFPSAKGEKLREVGFKAGMMKFGFQNPSSTETVVVTVNFPDFTQNGQGLSVSKTLAPDQNLTETISLAGYKLVLTNSEMNLSYSVSANLPPIQPIDFSFELKDAKYSYVEGYFPQLINSLPLDSIKWSAFNNFKAGNIEFTDPKITFIFKNSFGIPMRIDMNKLSANTQLNGWIDFVSPTYFNTATGRLEFDFAYPSLGQVGQTKTTNIYFDRTNSNMPSLVSALPNGILYDFAISTNPNNSPDNVFLTDSSRLGMGVKLELPFKGKVKKSILRDTFDVSFDMFKMLTTAGFKTVVDNTLPLSGDFQLYFYAKDGTFLDSMFVASPSLFTAADVDANGQVITPTQTKNEAYFDEVRFAKVKTARKIILKAALSSFQNGEKEVSIYSTSGLKVKLGVISGIDVVGIVK